MSLASRLIAIAASRPPDFIVGGAASPYLRRWWIIPRNRFFNIYLHRFWRSDDDRALHDHPWSNTSFVLVGRYREHTPEGVFERVAGDVVSREAGTLHRIEIYPGEQAITLFMTGPTIRVWGFACPKGWRHWRDFVDDRDTGKVGRGCGEHTTTSGNPLGVL